MQRLTTLLLFFTLISLCSSCGEVRLKAATFQTRNICHNPKLGQTVTVDMEYTSYTGVVSELSEDGIIVSTDPERITHILIQTSQIKRIYC